MLQGNQFHLKFHEFSAIAENPQGHTTHLTQTLYVYTDALLIFFHRYTSNHHTHCGYLIA